MELANVLPLRTYCPVKAQNAGLFIARGAAMHPTRIIVSHELIFVKQGEMDMWERDRIFHVEAGQTLHLWPNRQHGSTKPLPLGLKFYWIHFELEARNEKNGSGTGADFTPLIKIPQVEVIRQPEKLERLFLMFLSDQETGLLHPATANLLTMLMLVEVAHASEEKNLDTNGSNIVATWAHTYIRINYDRPLTTGKIAEALGYSPDYLERVYHKMYGYSLTEAIHRRRVDMACNYLLDSQMTIEQIAEKCGFTDPDYFRRIFRRYMQISPGTYRNEYSHIHVNTH